MATVEFQVFAINVKPSPETNDFEVRLLGDGEELIDRFWDGMIGLDPNDILLEPCPISSSAAGHSAVIARCGCGVIGCGNATVLVRSEGDKVIWVDGDRRIQFWVDQYETELRRAQADTSWETLDRTAARLLRERVDRERLASNGLTFKWASGRIARGEFTVSLLLEPGPYQILVPVRWQREAPEDLAEAASEVLRSDPRTWSGVRYLPQASGLGAPAISGPRWTRGSE